MARLLFARPRRAAATLLAAALLAVAAVVRGAPGALDTPAAPIAVSPPGGAYRAPDVALDALGRALIVWQGEDRAAPGSDIYGRLYDSGGRPLGEPFRVNAETIGEQRRPAAAALADGGFVVAWDTGSSSVWARRIDADGAPLGDDIALSAGPGRHRDPDLAAAGDGFVAAWTSVDPSGDDGVALRGFSAAGAPLRDGTFAAPPLAPDAIQMKPALAGAPDGALALVWEELQPLDGLAFRSALRLRRFSAAGDPLGEPLAVAESEAEELRDPAVSADAAGLLVAWAARDGDDNTRVVARRLGGDALAPVADATLSAPHPGERMGPALARAADGSALAAWAFAESVEARLLDAAGELAGEPFAPRPPSDDQHTMLDIAAAASPAEGPLWIVWSETTTAPQSSEVESAIYAQRYVDRLYQIALPLLAR